MLSRRLIWLLLGLVTLLSTLWAVVPGGMEAASPARVALPHADHRMELHGDRVVRLGLIRAAAQATAQTEAAVRQQLDSGKSIVALTEASGKNMADVLTRFDTRIDVAMTRAVANGRLPKSLADARAVWFKQSARLQVDQPGLRPAFPGLHEFHVVMITAAVRVSRIPRTQIRDQLKSCRTLTDIVATKGKSGSDVTNEAMTTLDRMLQADVERGALSAVQRDRWHAALQTAATKMTSTPGLHVAGKQCAK